MAALDVPDPGRLRDPLDLLDSEGAAELRQMGWTEDQIGLFIVLLTRTDLTLDQIVALRACDIHLEGDRLHVHVRALR